MPTCRHDRAALTAGHGDPGDAVLVPGQGERRFHIETGIVGNGGGITEILGAVDLAGGIEDSQIEAGTGITAVVGQRQPLAVKG